MILPPVVVSVSSIGIDQCQESKYQVSASVMVLS